MLAMMIFRDQTAFTDSLEALAAKLQVGLLVKSDCMAHTFLAITLGIEVSLK